MRRLLYQVGLAVVLLMALAYAPPIARSATREVSSAEDSGLGTLRQALLDAVSGDRIIFRTSIFDPAKPPTIFVRSALPTLNRNNVTVDASNAGVILDGRLVAAGTNGLVIRGDNCVIRGLTIQNFPSNGIIIEPDTNDNRAAGNVIGGDRSVGSGPNGQGNLIIANGDSGIDIHSTGAISNTVRGNYIGIERSGRFDQGNARSGVAIWQGASGNVVGGTIPGHRNVISGNDHNGVWIEGNGTNQNAVVGNNIGTRADGLEPVGNGFAGVAIQDGASNNTIGGKSSGAGNLISGNLSNGIYISDRGSNANQILGNLIGLNRQGTAKIGQKFNGVIIVNGATNTTVGSRDLGGRNVISGNELDGVLIQGLDTANNIVQGNYIGSNLTGTAAIPNGMHGVNLTNGAHHNTVGGNRSAGEGNLLSGNANHGLVIQYYAHHNTVLGNLIGPDATGSKSLGNQPFGGVDVAEAAHDNTIGPGNVISGNQTDGIALFDNTGDGTNDNRVIGNLVGLTADGKNPLPNAGVGIANIRGARRTLIKSNTIWFNQTYGIWVAPCTDISIGNTISQNSIYSNTLGGILTDCQVPPPTLKVTSVGTAETITGKTFAGALVEIFSDDEDQGRVYEGTVRADNNGNFSFSKPRFIGPNMTATSTNAAGDTSAFAQPAHLLWTILLYLNGDNDLSQAMFDTMDSIVAANPSPRANVLALVDGKSGPRGSTMLYDITHGQAISLNVPSVTTGERNMGDGKTLVDFVTWARSNYPARHTMLSILDHGGGWAPSGEDFIPGSTPHKHAWFAGGSGLSWDFSSNYDYLDSPEIRQALASITNNGAKKLDVLFYDVCLMGMLEVAYQVKEYATFFVSSQNIGWAPGGLQNRYVRTIQSVTPTATPRDVAALLVESYANSIPSIQHPYTISALDLTKLPAVVDATNQLALATSQRVSNPQAADRLKQAYDDSQKIDYDSDFQLEPATDGFVDLYDFAQHVSQQFGDPVITKHANDVVAALNTTIVAERHRSGNPWPFPTRVWNLDNVHGLSIFLPLGEDLLLPVTVSQASVLAPAQTIDLHLRDTYTTTQLLFVSDTTWESLIDKYYKIVAVPTGTTNGPIGGLLTSDSIPPQTTITITGRLDLSQTIRIEWSATDKQLDVHGNRIDGAGVTGATLWWQPPPPQKEPMPIATQGDVKGAFTFTLTKRGCNILSVRAIDQVSNIEPLVNGPNARTVYLAVGPCLVYIPLVRG
jgi:hypothetical protein